MQWHLGHQSLPFCLPRLITVHAVQCRWLMTCSLTLKVLWPLNTLRVEMHPHFFYAGKTLASLTQLIFLPTRNNSEQRMTILVSLVKRHRSWVFISSTPSALKSHNSLWPTLKRIKDVSPALDYSAVSRSALWREAHGFKCTSGTRGIIAHFRGSIQSMHLL